MADHNIFLALLFIHLSSWKILIEADQFEQARRAQAEMKSLRRELAQHWQGAQPFRWSAPLKPSQPTALGRGGTQVTSDLPAVKALFFGQDAFEKWNQLWKRPWPHELV